MQTSSLSFGFSSCPNDTFIFDAMYHEKIDVEGLNFEYVIEDVEKLNHLALTSRIDVTKLSYFSFAKLLGVYEMMSSGGALGFNCGPLVVKRQGVELTNDTSKLTMAIPGFNTTANLLSTLAYPNLKQKFAMNFAAIEDAVLNGDVDLGLIIHESRFTYQDKGLEQVADLGHFWQEYANAPIPLGGIAIKATMDFDLKSKIERVIKRSAAYAFDHPGSGNEFIVKHSQNMQPEVIRAHIDLYVNEYSLDLSEIGKAGVRKFVSILEEKEIIAPFGGKIFVNE